MQDRGDKQTLAWPASFAPVTDAHGFHAFEGQDLLHQLRHRRWTTHQHRRITGVIACHNRFMSALAASGSNP